MSTQSNSLSFFRQGYDVEGSSPYISLSLPLSLFRKGYGEEVSPLHRALCAPPTIIL